LQVKVKVKVKVKFSLFVRVLEVYLHSFLNLALSWKQAVSFKAPPVAFLPGKKTTIPIEWKTGWASGSQSTLSRRDKSLAPTGNQTTVLRTSSP
jgi:hypothetical protein